MVLEYRPCLSEFPSPTLTSTNRRSSSRMARSSKHAKERENQLLVTTWLNCSLDQKELLVSSPKVSSLHRKNKAWTDLRALCSNSKTCTCTPNNSCRCPIPRCSESNTSRICNPKQRNRNSYAYHFIYVYPRLISAQNALNSATTNSCTQQTPTECLLANGPRRIRFSSNFKVPPRVP